jgi:tetratricopeptide (TPR) repeat protein
MIYMESSGWKRDEAPPSAREWRARAIEDLTQARDGGLKGGDLEYCLASLAVAEGQPQKAVTLLSKLLEGNDKREEHYKLRGEAQFLLAEGASPEIRSDLLKRSLADFAEAIRMRPNYHQAYRRRGGLQFLTGHTDECLADLQAGLQMNPGDSTALSDLGTYFQRTNRIDAALDYFARALQADPDNFRALNNRSSIRMAQKDYAAARADLERALKISPDHVAGIFNLAVARDALGDTEEAIRLLSTILARQTAFARGFHARAVLRHKLGRWAEALDDLEKASGIDPANYQTACRPYIDDCRKKLGRP